MVIQYFGMGMVKVSLGEEVLAFAPIGKGGSMKGPSFGSNVALVPLREVNYNGVENVTYGAKQPFVIDGPGEYEVNGTFIKGIADGANTIYSVVFDDIRLAHLGVFTGSAIKAEMKEALGEVDILFVPPSAYKLYLALDAKIIIPLYCASNNPSGDILKQFLKEAGEEGVKAIDKLVIKKKELEGKGGEIIVIKSWE